MAIRVKLAGVLALMLLGTMMLAGCEAAKSTSGEADASSGSPQAISAENRETLPEGFPLEVPAMDGEVTEIETGDLNLGPWLYRMQSPHGRDAITAWYRQAYEGRSWKVVDEASGTTAQVLVLTKGSGAWSTVRVSANEDGSHIECWTGIGVPMPPEALPPGSAGAAEV